MHYACDITFAALAIACAPAIAETVQLAVEVEVVSATKICNKAVAVLMSGLPMTEAEARAFMLVLGAPSTAKCLEVIFANLSSPTNGFKVHQVSSDAIKPQTP